MHSPPYYCRAILGTELAALRRFNEKIACFSLPRGHIAFRRFSFFPLADLSSWQTQKGTTWNGKGLRPGGSGRSPARSSHRPVRAFLMHTVPQIMGSLRDDRLSGPPAPTEADSAPVAGGKCSSRDCARGCGGLAT